MKLFHSKRGITPLFATIILVLFASAIGVVAINVGRAQIEVNTQCSLEIGLQASILNNQPQVCLIPTANQLFFIMENGQTIDIEALRIRIIGEDGILVKELDDSRIERGNPLLRYEEYNVQRYGNVRQVKFTPKIKLYDQNIYCNEQAFILENVRECEVAT